MRAVKGGSTDVSVVIKIIDATDGTPENAVEHNSAGIALWYRRPGAAQTAITLAPLTALTDAHADGGLELIGDGLYRVDLPDAAVAAGVDHVIIGGTVTGMVVLGGELPLVAYDPQDAAALGLSAFTTLAQYIDTEVAAILDDTGTTLPGLIAALNNLSQAQAQAAAEAALNAAQTESYPTAGAAASITQMNYAIMQFLHEAVKTGAVMSIKKVDGATQAYELTLNNATNPTSVTRTA